MPSLNLYVNEVAFIQPSNVDGKGLPVKPLSASYVSSDAAKVVVLGVLADGYTAQIQALGAVDDTANITMTVAGEGGNKTSVLAVTIVTRLPVTVVAESSLKPVAVKERPDCGPPG